jgi:class 3 adenylate cyclase
MDQFVADPMIKRTAPLTAADFEALGVYDPADQHAELQLELLEYLVSLGASADDLVEYRCSLAGVATIVVSRGGKALTRSEAGQSAGMPLPKVLQFIRAAGFAEPGPNDRVISDRFTDFAEAAATAEAIFGEAATLQLVRVMGSAMARLADAAVSAFLVHVEPGARGADPVGLGAARASAQAAALLPAASTMLEILLRQHIIRARRPMAGDTSDGYETQRRCVGFVDLVGSTALAQRLSTRELGSLITEFEHTAADAITAGGGRVVKLIGDEVMYVTAHESAALSIALDLVALLDEHPTLPAVRTGLAAGEVLLRAGDVFGPVVNLAARAAKVAAAREIVMPAELASAAGVEAEALGPHQLKGFAEDVRLCRIKAPSLREAGAWRHARVSSAAG